MIKLTLEVEDNEGNGARVSPDLHVVADDATGLEAESIGNDEIRGQL